MSANCIVLQAHFFPHDEYPDPLISDQFDEHELGGCQFMPREDESTH